MKHGVRTIFIAVSTCLLLPLYNIHGGGIASGEEIDEIANTGKEINVIQSYYPSDNYHESMNDIDYVFDDGICTARGTSSGYSQLKLYLDKNKLPVGIIPSQVYKAYCSSSDKNLAFSIVFYSNQEIIKQLYFTEDSVFAVPEDAEGCLIRFWVNKDKTVNATISAKVVYVEQSYAEFNTISNTYQNTYLTEHYANTYNIQCNPELTTENDYYLPSQGVDVDMTAAIQSMLNVTGYCHLGPGDYLVTGIEIPNYGMLAGSGYSTRLILDSSVETGYAVKLKNYGCVKDVQIVGALENIETDSNIGRRHGILFEGMADSQDNPISYYRSTVENCLIQNFNGGGITCVNTGLSPSANLLVSDVRTVRCGAGINISYFSEYSRFTNVCATECYYGCVCNGGNNVFVNCDFSENTTGLLIDNGNGQSRNNTHGTFDACSFNHSGKNSGNAIQILGATAGEVFTGCQIFYGKIDICDSIGIRFDACNLGKQVPINVTNSTTCIFSDCTMYSNEESPLLQECNKSLFFRDCFLRDGEVYNPMNGQ